MLPTPPHLGQYVVQPSWNVMAHGGAREGKCTGNWRMEWVASTLHTTSEPLMRTTRLPVVDWTDAPDDLNGLVRFAERRNLISALVPSDFKSSLRRGDGNKPHRSKPPNSLLASKTPPYSVIPHVLLQSSTQPVYSLLRADRRGRG